MSSYYHLAYIYLWSIQVSWSLHLKSYLSNLGENQENPPYPPLFLHPGSISLVWVSGGLGCPIFTYTRLSISSLSFWFLIFSSLRHILVFTLHCTYIDHVLVSAWNTVFYLFYYHLRCLELILASTLTPVLLIVMFRALCERIYRQHVWYIIWIFSEFIWLYVNLSAICVAYFSYFCLMYCVLLVQKE